MSKIVLICLFLSLNSCSNKPLITLNGSTMGTTYSIKIINPDGFDKTLIDQRLAEISQIFSTWNPQSELSLLNKKPINQWINVSAELFFVLTVAKKIHQQTYGYFDSGMGRLLDLWGFGADKIDNKPSPKQVEKALKLSSIKHIRLKNKKVKKRADLHLNLSAIVKGYAVDEIAKLLKMHKIKHFLVEIGGEVIASGENIDKNWHIGIESPKSKPISIMLNNQAIATSGNYHNYFIWQGKPYAHILNPNTGSPAQTDLRSVSVLAKQTMIADAYATAMMAMGSKKATALAKQLNLSIILILDKQHHFKQVKINL